MQEPNAYFNYNGDLYFFKQLHAASKADTIYGSKFLNSR